MKKAILFGTLVLALLLSGCPYPPPDNNGDNGDDEGSPIVFTVLPTLPTATVGEQYKYSFCKPDLSLTSDLCGAFSATINPTGGQPPYSFQLDTMGGFPPHGIILNLNGLLTGTPTAEGERTFRVCAVDQTRSQSCQTTSLTVIAKVTLTVLWSGTGTGRVGWDTSAGEADCEYDTTGAYRCIIPMSHGSTVTLTAEPDEGSSFTGWSGPCSGTGECTITMDEDKEVTVAFAIESEDNGNHDGPNGTTELTVSIQSGTCIVRERFSWGTPISFTVDLSGSASGPVGASLQLVYTDLGWDCGAWGSNCQRDEGEPASTNWNSQGNGATGMQDLLQVNVCTAGCASDSVTVTCPTS